MQHLTCKPIRTTNRGSRDYVRNGVPFQNSNNQLFGRWETPTLYVVYSYGQHWPLFVYDTTLSTWYENEDRCSMTTSHHRSYAHPHCNTETRSCGWLRGMIAGRVGQHLQMLRLERTLGLAA